MAKAKFLLIANDNLIKLVGLKNEVTGLFVNDAVVTATLFDSLNNEVPGQTWPVTLVFVTASNGDYQATLQDTVQITAGIFYRLQINADGQGLQAQWEPMVEAVTRKLT